MLAFHPKENKNSTLNDLLLSSALANALAPKAPP